MFNSLKSFSFLEILKRQSPQNYKNDSQGIVFIIISCQRILFCRLFEGLGWTLRTGFLWLVEGKRRKCRSHFGSNHFGSNADPRSCEASTGWLKAPRSLGRLPPTMLSDQARAKQFMNELQGMMAGGGGGGKDRQVGPPAQTATPDPRLQARPSRTEQGMTLYMRVLQFLPPFGVLLLQKGQSGRTDPLWPRKPPALRQQIKAATEEQVKEALDAALKKVQETKLQTLSVRDQKSNLMSQAKSLACRNLSQDKQASCGGGPAAPESPGGWRVHRRNGSSSAVCQNTGPRWGPYGQCGLGNPFANRRGWDWRCGNGRDFGRPGVWRAGARRCSPPPFAPTPPPTARRDCRGRSEGPPQSDEAMLREFRARLEVAGAAPPPSPPAAFCSQPPLPFRLGSRIPPGILEPGRRDPLPRNQAGNNQGHPEEQSGRRHSSILPHDLFDLSPLLAFVCDMQGWMARPQLL